MTIVDKDGNTGLYDYLWKAPKSKDEYMHFVTTGPRTGSVTIDTKSLTSRQREIFAWVLEAVEITDGDQEEGRSYRIEADGKDLVQLGSARFVTVAGSLLNFWNDAHYSLFEHWMDIERIERCERLIEAGKEGREEVSPQTVKCCETLWRKIYGGER